MVADPARFLTQLVAFHDRAFVRAHRLVGLREREVPTSLGPLGLLELEGRGDGPPLVLLHGLGAKAGDWAPLMVRLARAHRRVSALELPGHGAGDVPTFDLDAFDAALNEALLVAAPAGSVLVGNSLGGLLAVRHATQRRDLAGLVLISPGGAPADREHLEGILERFQLRTHAQALAFAASLFPRRTPLDHVLALGLRGRLSRPGLRAIIEGLPLDRVLRAEELASLTVPTAVIWGVRDALLPVSHADFFEAHLPPGSIVLRPEELGHSPLVDSPGVTARLIADVVARLVRR